MSAERERERVVSRINELHAALRDARSPDLRRELEAALETCERRLADLQREPAERD